MISVSKFIELYIEEFDSNYHSMYTSVKNMYISMYGKLEWFKFIYGINHSNKIEMSNYLIKWITSNKLQAKFQVEQKKVLQNWESLRVAKSKIGLKAHNQEYGSVKSSNIQLKGTSKLLPVGEHNEVSVHTDWLIGRLDKLIVLPNNYVKIEDLKTGDIKKQNFKEPANTFNSKVELQLNLYAHILEQIGYIVQEIYVIHRKPFGDIKLKIHYKKDYLSRVINDYKQNNKLI